MSEMLKVYQNQNAILPMQNLYVTSEVFKNYSFGAFAFINITEDVYLLVKICLNEDVYICNACFLDATVFMFKSNLKIIDPDTIITLKSLISKADIMPVKKIKLAKLVKVNVISSNIKTVINLKQNKNLATMLVKNILKQFIIPANGIVFCKSVPEIKISQIYVKSVNGIQTKDMDAFEVDKNTVVEIEDVLSEELHNQKLGSALFQELFCSDDKMGKELTLQKITKIIQSIINIPTSITATQPDRNILIVGPTGCGKSSIVNFISQKASKIVLPIHCITKTEFLKEFSAALTKAKLHVEANENVVIVIKDIDRICHLKNDQSGGKTQLLIHEVKCHLDKLKAYSKISVVATTCNPENIDFVLKKPGCFRQEVEVPMLTERDREHVFQVLAREFQLSCSPASAKAVAKWTPGYVLADLLAVVRDARNYHNNKKLSRENEEEILKRSVSRTLPSNLRGTRGLITTSKTSFSDIGGLEQVKKTLKMSVQWQMNNAECLNRLGIPPTKGILLYGPPGCAKTSLVKALAYESNATFLAVSAADLYSPYVGEAEKRLSKLFVQARIGAPSIVFIDEIDALVGSKDGNRDHGVQERILATLLMEMDGIGINLKTSDTLFKLAENETETGEVKKTHKTVDNLRVVIVGATNRPELLDDALKRPGRFDKLILIPPPDLTERLAILRKLTEKMPLGEDVNLEFVAKSTECCSGADLKSICTESALLALSNRGMDSKNVLKEDFDRILASFKPSLQENKKYKIN